MPITSVIALPGWHIPITCSLWCHHSFCSCACSDRDTAHSHRHSEGWPAQPACTCVTGASSVSQRQHRSHHHCVCLLFTGLVLDLCCWAEGNWACHEDVLSCWKLKRDAMKTWGRWSNKSKALNKQHSISVPQSTWSCDRVTSLERGIQRISSPLKQLIEDFPVPCLPMECGKRSE